MSGLLNTRWFFHLLFWAVFISLFTGILSLRYGWWESFKDVLLGAAAFAIAIYINLLWLIPSFLRTGKYFTYSILLLLLVLLVSPIHAYTEYVSFYNSPEFEGKIKFQRLLAISFVNVFSMTALSSGLKFGKDWFQQQQVNKTLENEKLLSELNLLKSQINPHFLFNTLNSLYALSLRKSDDAPEVVLRLSEMMRYMLYETNAQKVPLVKELSYTRNYIELEKIRYGKETTIQMEMNGEVTNQSIAPLVFLPFVENSFKHGLSNALHTGFVSLIFEIEDNAITMVLENSIPQGKVESQKIGGFGLRNVIQRLDLIYPGNYSLLADTTESKHSVTLKIMLS